jgi:hypothetical protein
MRGVGLHASLFLYQWRLTGITPVFYPLIAFTRAAVVKDCTPAIQSENTTNSKNTLTEDVRVTEDNQDNSSTTGDKKCASGSIKSITWTSFG